MEIRERYRSHSASLQSLGGDCLGKLRGILALHTAAAASNSRDLRGNNAARGAPIEKSHINLNRLDELTVGSGAEQSTFL
jgi:hypothetical protein